MKMLNKFMNIKIVSFGLMNKKTIVNQIGGLKHVQLILKIVLL